MKHLWIYTARSKSWLPHFLDRSLIHIPDNIIKGPKKDQHIIKPLFVRISRAPMLRLKTKTPLRRCKLLISKLNLYAASQGYEFMKKNKVVNDFSRSHCISGIRFVKIIRSSCFIKSEKKFSGYNKSEYKN